MEEWLSMWDRGIANVSFEHFADRLIQLRKLASLPEIFFCFPFSPFFFAYINRIPRSSLNMELASGTFLKRENESNPLFSSWIRMKQMIVPSAEEVRAGMNKKGIEVGQATAIAELAIHPTTCWVWSHERS